jgi:hypothetical protein
MHLVYGRKHSDQTILQWVQSLILDYTLSNDQGNLSLIHFMYGNTVCFIILKNIYIVDISEDYNQNPMTI